MTCPTVTVVEVADEEEEELDEGEMSSSNRCSSHELFQ